MTDKFARRQIVGRRCFEQVVEEANRSPLSSSKVPQIGTVSLEDGLNERLVVLKHPQLDRAIEDEGKQLLDRDSIKPKATLKLADAAPGLECALPPCLCVAK